MPRTKLKKTTAKRKNSTTEEDKYALFSAELEKGRTDDEQGIESLYSLLSMA